MSPLPFLEQMKIKTGIETLEQLEIPNHKSQISNKSQ
jgi:hypothetical protein